MTTSYCHVQHTLDQRRAELLVAQNRQKLVEADQEFPLPWEVSCGKPGEPFLPSCSTVSLQEKRPEQNKSERTLMHLHGSNVRSWGALETGTQVATTSSSDFLQPPPFQTPVHTSRIALGCLSDLSYTKSFSIVNTAIYLSFSNSEISDAKELLRFSDIPDYASQISSHIMNYSLSVS